MKKTNFKRAAACLLILLLVFTMWSYAESAIDASQAPAAAEAAAAVTEAPVERVSGDPSEIVEQGDLEARIAELQAGTADPELSFGDGISKIWQSTGFKQGEWKQYIMIAIACLLLYLAIVKGFEPLLLLPIAFGMLLANLPAAGLSSHFGPSFADYEASNFYTFYPTLNEAVAQAKYLGKATSDIALRFNEVTGTMQYALQTSNGGLMYYLYHGVKLGIFPPLIFMGVGAMTDFGPLIANPKSLLLGAAAQLGIFMTFTGAKLLGFTAAEAGSIGIIGGADGPTAIFVTTKMAPHLLGAIAVAAYSYMALVPVIQPPIMKALTTKKERLIRMPQLRPVSKVELVIFPIMVTIIVSLLLPDAATLVGCLMLGNLFRVSGVVERLNKTAQNELCNIVTIFLGLTVGATTSGPEFLSLQTLEIIVLGVVAFSCGTAGGVLLGKLMNVLSGGHINPLIGSAGVSAVPMAARVSQKVGQDEDPGNFLLMNAMGPNVAGVIGSAIAAGVLISLFAH